MWFDWDIFISQLFSLAYVQGAALALGVGTLAMALGVLVGFGVALMRLGKRRLVRDIAAGYVWFFRAMPPLLVLLIVWNAGPQLLPVLRDDWFSPFVAAVIGLGIVESAYLAEIFRSALIGVDPGQSLAGRALGMTPWQVLRKIMIPQAVRIAIPPSGNEFIGLVKSTSLATVISLQELMTIAQKGVQMTYRYAEYYAAAIVYYLVIVSLLMLVQGYVERRLSWSSKVKGRPGVRTRLKELVP